MKLTLLDFLIISLYLASTIVIGLVLKKRAQKDKTAYILGGNKLPWYMLGLSNASGMFDILRYHVAGYPGFCVWAEIHMDTLVMAGLQPDFPDGIYLHLVASFKCNHRG